ncbi:MAG: VWA domain-containing protein [Acidobacteriota bacterium]
MTTVELRLDGEVVGQLRGEPWVIACDFGSELAPHELLAIGYDAEGRAIARAEQWLNLPRPRSRVELILDESSGAPQTARLVWHSADAEAPDAWRVSFDGQLLEVADPTAFQLPAYDPEVPHLLQAELLFGGRVVHTERVVGGASGDLVDTELTALPVVVDGKAPTPKEMAGWFTKDGRPLEVVSVERGGADIVLVQEATPRLWAKQMRMRKDAMVHGGAKDALSRKLNSGLNHDDSLRVLLPIAERGVGATLEQFHISHDFSTVEYGPSSTGVGEKQIATPRAEGILSTLPYPPEGPLRGDAPRRVADAVAVAGQAAAAGRRKRAVVLFKDAGTRDLSSTTPAMVRRYLERLQVPLLVWSPDQAKTDPWGEVTDVSSSRELLRGVLELRQTLGNQTIVWLRGRHLPQDIELSPAAAERLSRVGAGGVDLPAAVEAEFEPWLAETVIESESPEATASAGVRTAVPTEAVPTEAVPTETVPTETVPTDARPFAATQRVAEPLDAAATTVIDTVDVRLVNVDVVVTDAKGKRRRDLVREDFIIYEDGQPVDIHHFVPPTDPEPAVAANFADADADAAPATVDTSVELPRLVIFFDLLRLQGADRKRLAQALRDVLHEAPPMRTMIVTYNRAMKVRQPFTDEPLAWTEVLDAIERIEPARVGTPDGRGEMAEELAAVQREIKGAGTPLETRQAEARRRSALAQLESITGALQAEIRSTLAAIRQLTQSLGGVDGRKLLLYVGDNLELTPALELFEEAQLTLASEDDLQAANMRSAASAFEIRADFDGLLREAHAQGVTFYGVTPRNRGGRDVTERGVYGTTVVAGAAGLQGRLPSRRQELVKEAVCRLTVESGGLCQVGGTEPRLLLRETFEDLGGTYSLAYAPERPPDGAFHRLEVEIKRPGLEARHRPGYVDKTTETRLHDRLAAALYFSDAEDALGVTVTAGEIEPSSAGTNRSQSLVPLEVRVPVSRLGLFPLADGEKLGVKAQLLVQTQNAAGGVTGVQEYPITFQVRGDRLAVEPPLTYAHKLHLLLEPGEYKVAIGFWDEIGRVGSFVSREVAVE